MIVSKLIFVLSWSLLFCLASCFGLGVKGMGSIDDWIHDEEMSLKATRNLRKKIDLLLSEKARKLIKEKLEDDAQLMTLGSNYQFSNVVEVTLPIDINLVGFNGEGQNSGYVDERYLQRHLSALSNEESMIQVIHSKDSSKANFHTFPVRIKYNYEVKKLSKTLWSRLSDRIDSQVLQNKSSKGAASPVSIIDVNAIDMIIQSFFDSHVGQTSFPAYSLFLLNPRAPDFSHSTFGIDRYLYSYPNNSGCYFNIWSSGTSRYTWIDLTAGPTNYGPSIQGEGCVSEYSLPRINSSSGEDSYQPLSPALLSDICNLVHKASLYLFVPSLDRFPLLSQKEDRKVRLHIVYFKYKASRRLADVQWKQIAKVIEQLPSTANKDIVVDPHETTVYYENCDVCLLAIHGSRRRVTGSPLGEESGFVDPSMYIDSVELHKLLSQFNDEISRLVDYASPNKRGKDYESLSVLVFESDELLEEGMLAVPVNNMVLAVSPEPLNGPWYLDFECENMKNIAKTCRDLSRSILGAVLQVGWGITPTFQRWCPINSRIVADYMFSLVQTPFGPFNTLTNFSYSVNDAASRNILLAKIDTAIRIVDEINGHLSWYRTKGGNLLEPESRLVRASFVQFHVLLEHALSRLGKLLSLQNFEHSRSYVNVLQYIAESVKILTLHSAARYETSLLEC